MSPSLQRLALVAVLLILPMFLAPVPGRAQAVTPSHLFLPSILDSHERANSPEGEPDDGATPLVADTRLPLGFSDTQVVAGLVQPVAMDIAPDGRLFVAQKLGRVRIIRNGVINSSPFLSLDPNNLRTEGERGLIGIALDPNFTQNHYVYVRYTVGNAAANTCRHRLSRFRANGDVAVANSEEILFDMGACAGSGNHNGGTIQFGTDGKLYTTLGEQGTPANAQSLANLFGKLLRVNKDGSIPTSNPFFNSTSGNNRAIWAYGLRNPFVFAVQPGTGRLWINDVGQNDWEEIDVGRAGANYGWPSCEGPCPSPDPRYVDPLYSYPTSDGCAITGGVFYNAPRLNFPSGYQGLYFFTDLCGGWIRTLNPANRTLRTFASGYAALGRPVDLDVGPDGTLYILLQGLDRDNSSVRRIRFTDRIFADGFESGGLGAWSAANTDGGDLGVTTGAALVGSFGMRALVDNNGALSVTDERPAAEARYRARFYFHPNAMRMAQGDRHVLFYGFSGSGVTRPVLRVQIRFNNGAYQVQAGLFNDRTTWRNSLWFTLSNARHYLELNWRAAIAAGANDGALNFWIDGVRRASLTGVDNDTRRIERVRLGALAGIDNGTRGVYRFDAFESRRLRYIGAADVQTAETEEPMGDPAQLELWVDTDESDPAEAELLRELLGEAEQSVPEQGTNQKLHLPMVGR